MNKSRICPVCDYEIPDEARFLCPRCHFELKWLNNSEEIERAKQLLWKWANPYDKEEEKLETKKFDSAGCIIIVMSIGLLILWVFWQLDAF